jgi:DNA-binding ferritin-like protein (Dps family)
MRGGCRRDKHTTRSVCWLARRRGETSPLRKKTNGGLKKLRVFARKAQPRKCFGEALLTNIFKKNSLLKQTQMMEARVKNIVELFIGNLREKAEYKAVVQLSKSLPEDYQYVYKAIETYMYNAAFSGETFRILMDLLESFAVASQDGKPVLSVTGKDVGAFCDDLLDAFGLIPRSSAAVETSTPLTNLGIKQMQ